MNTIAVDDGIAMGHDGMLYSSPLPRPHRGQRRIHGERAQGRRTRLHQQLRQGHRACSAAMPLNIPAVFVSGGPMETGHITQKDGSDRQLDLIDTMIDSRQNPNVSDGRIKAIEDNSCPGCGSCSECSLRTR